MFVAETAEGRKTVGRFKTVKKEVNLLGVPTPSRNGAAPEIKREPAPSSVAAKHSFSTVRNNNCFCPFPVFWRESSLVPSLG
jgi:hypothetical protein